VVGFLPAINAIIKSRFYPCFGRREIKRWAGSVVYKPGFRNDWTHMVIYEYKGEFVLLSYKQGNVVAFHLCCFAVATS
jgi:hypothetical protein